MMAIPIYANGNVTIYATGHKGFLACWCEQPVARFNNIDSALQYMGNEFGIYDK